jgi:hypothetical protein
MGKKIGIDHAKEKVKKLREISKSWSNATTLMAINEELHNAKTIEERVELLEFKNEIMEGALFGRVYSIYTD